MLRQFVTPNEFLSDHSVMRYGGKNADETIRLKLSAAEREVRELLRSKDTKTRQLQVPQMLVGTYAVLTTKASDTTGDSRSLSGTRYVVECFTDDTSAVFKLQGSEDGTNWRSVQDRITGTDVVIEPTGAGIYSAPFAESYPYYRYILETDSSVSFLVYLVDGSFDLLIGYKALELLYEDNLGEDRVNNKHEQAAMKFQKLFDKLVADVDLDEDGTVDSDERDSKQVHRLYR